MKKDAIQKAHELAVYLESEMADQKETNHPMDALWQSIYDVCQLASSGIIDTIKPEELQAGITWLKENQKETKEYKNFTLNF